MTWEMDLRSSLTPTSNHPPGTPGAGRTRFRACSPDRGPGERLDVADYAGGPAPSPTDERVLAPPCARMPHHSLRAHHGAGARTAGRHRTGPAAPAGRCAG